MLNGMKKADIRSKELVEEAEGRIEREMQKTKLEMDKMVRIQAKEMAEEILIENLGKDEQSKILDNLISKIGKPHGRK